ncbi:MAG TPA: SIMPL domain-containing protein [Fibrobacteria bacterium]|nr:SIMPL domain-containing protein [Fibrobacteria bacterium]
MRQSLAVVALAVVSQATEINTIGYGEVSAWPNQVEIRVETRVVRPRLRDALDESRRIEELALGIARTYNKTQDSSTYGFRTVTDKETRWTGPSMSREEFVGYSATQIFTAKLMDLEKVTPFVDEILKLPDTKVANLRFGHTKEDSLKTAAEIVSVKDAVDKGRLIAKSLSIDGLRIKSISDYVELKQPDGWAVRGGGQIEVSVSGKGIGARGISFSPSALVFTSSTHVVQTNDAMGSRQ